MYFCYVDESGDYGAFNAAMPNKSGSPYIILAGLKILFSGFQQIQFLFRLLTLLPIL